MDDSVLSDKRYRQLAVLGQGGMGKVLKCQDTVLERNIALKVLLHEYDENTLKRFQKEAEATAKLNHPNIIKVLDFGRLDEGSLYLSMEFLRGVGLDTVIKQRGYLEIEEALEIVDQVCRGLNHAHKKGILHRDIKPSNVMLTEDENGKEVVKLVDFGIARFRREDEQKLTATGVIVGSPLYLSPGTATAEDSDTRSEVYSLGCMLFELLTGRPPFRGENAMATMLMHMNDEPPTLSEIREEGFSEELESIVAKCLEKDRDLRYQDVEELRLALEKFLERMREKDEYLQEEEERRQTEEKQAELKKRLGHLSRKHIVFLIILLLVLPLVAFFLYHPIEIDKVEMEALDPPTDTEKEKAPSELTYMDHSGRLDIPKGSKASEGIYRTNIDVDDDYLRYRFHDHPRTEDANFWMIQFKNCSVKGPGLKYLPANFTSLLFKETDLTDEGLGELAKLPTLDYLALQLNRDVSAKGIAKLSKSSLTNLTYHPLGPKIQPSKLADNVYDREVEYGKFISARSNMLQVTPVEVYKQIGKIKSLKELSLADREIGAEKVYELSGLNRLRILHLFNSGTISADIVKHLGKLKNLNALLFEKSELSEAGFAALRQLKLERIKLTQKIDRGQLSRLAKIRTLGAVTIPRTTDSKLVESFVRKRPDVEVNISMQQ